MGTWDTELNLTSPISGRVIKENGEYVNIADLLVDSIGGGVTETEALIFSTSNGVTLRDTSGAGIPVLSIRPKTASKDEGRTVIPLDTNLFASANCYYEIIINGTLTGASWADVAATSSVEVDKSSTAISGGLLIASGYVSTSVSGGAEAILGRDSLLGRLGLGYNEITNIGDTLSIKIVPFGGTVPTSATIQWREVLSS